MQSPSSAVSVVLRTGREWCHNHCSQGLVEKWAGQISGKLLDAEAAWIREEAAQRRASAESSAVARHEVRRCAPIPVTWSSGDALVHAHLLAGQAC